MIYEKNANRCETIAWICENQLGRRNLTKEQKKSLIGKQYEAEQQRQGANNPLPSPPHLATELDCSSEGILQADIHETVVPLIVPMPLMRSVWSISFFRISYDLVGFIPLNELMKEETA